MKPNTAYRSVLTLLILIAVYFCSISTPVFANGNKEQNNLVPVQNTLTPEIRNLLRTEPTVKPDWVVTVPQSNTEISFVGTSQPFNTEADAREGAREHARQQVVEYYGMIIENQAVSRYLLSGNTSDTLDPYINREDEIRSYAQYFVSEVSTVRYYTEVWLNNNKEEYVVYVLCQIPRRKVEEDIANFARNTSERYISLLSQRDTLKATLESYTQVIKALEQNPLHRITAYYDSSNGRMGLYEYALIRINELAGSVSIEPIQTRMIYETETLNTPLKLKSPIIPSTGYLNCKATLYGTGNPVVFPSFPNAGEDTFVLVNNPLPSGSYNVQIEILFSELTEGIVKNVTGGFSFIVTSLNPLLETKDAMEAGIKRAVDALAAGLPSQIETIIGPFTLTGTDIPTGLSRYLSERVKNDAMNNRDQKYRVVEGDGDNRAALTGFFTRRNNRVDVIIELSTPTGTGNGSQSFTLSVAMLNEWDIEIDSERVYEPPLLPDLLTQDINIQALFNSPSMTYLHREPLVMTLKADSNCYFKIIHIDVNNQMKVIYPVNQSDNNYLRANDAMTVFGNQNHMLYGPYGEEIILLAASIEQFTDLNTNIVSWTKATEEAIRESVGGNRGDIKSYTITVLRPNDEYEYKKPENMNEMLQNLRDDIIRQGGIFSGTSISGYYILNNIRGSYCVLEDAPDMIQFAAYNLDNFTGGQNAGVRTRGQGFTFNFIKPENINRAVQEVRNIIESKGGTFSGNEQQGSFRVNGIAGQYQVNDRVSVTIIEKPFIIPNLLIENEVKNYFGR